MAATLAAKIAAANRAVGLGAAATSGIASTSEAKKAYWCETPLRRGRELARIAEPRRLDQLCRGNLRVGVLGDSRELVPVERPVEPGAEPAAMADVGRNEESLRVGLDEHLLHSGRGRAPDRKAAVAVV